MTKTVAKNTKSELIEAAERLLATRGIGAVTAMEIIKDANARDFLRVRIRSQMKHDANVSGFAVRKISRIRRVRVRIRVRIHIPGNNSVNNFKGNFQCCISCFLVIASDLYDL